MEFKIRGRNDYFWEKTIFVDTESPDIKEKSDLFVKFFHHLFDLTI